MLQLSRLNQRALASLTQQTPLPAKTPPPERLEALADRWIADLRRERERLAQRAGPITRLRERLDRALRTDAVERLDQPQVSDARKVQIVQDLDALNRMIFSYYRFFRAIEPMIRQVEAREGRPARILELASGAGAFTLLAPGLARRRGVHIEITGSDIVDAYVARGNEEARRRGSQARFIKLNAFDMGDQDPGTWDIAFIAQSLHHFTPGQIARMIEQSRRVCTTGFVGVDGHRSLLLLSTVPGWGLAFRSRDFAHDAFLSTRKFYSEDELRLISRLAAPDLESTVATSHPGYSVLRIPFRGPPS